jgi:hypothetical protein
MLTRIPNAAIPCTITPLLVASSSADKLPIKTAGNTIFAYFSGRQKQ